VTEAETIKGLTAENRQLKMELLETRLELRQVHLATLIVNARLLALRNGTLMDSAGLGPSDPDQRPHRYKDREVEIICSTMSRALVVKNGKGEVMVAQAWNGTMEVVAQDFEQTRKYVRELETKLLWHPLTGLALGAKSPAIAGNDRAEPKVSRGSPAD
jgi:hypothetical protein